MQSLAQFKKRTYLCTINLNNLFYLKNCTIETKEEYPTRCSFLFFYHCPVDQRSGWRIALGKCWTSGLSGWWSVVTEGVAK